MPARHNRLDRRDFIKSGGQVTAAAALLGANAVQGAAPVDKKVTFTGALPTRELGKTRVKLPILGRFLRSRGHISFSDVWPRPRCSGKYTAASLFVDDLQVACQNFGVSQQFAHCSGVLRIGRTLQMCHSGCSE